MMGFFVGTPGATPPIGGGGGTGGAPANKFKTHVVIK